MSTMHHTCVGGNKKMVAMRKVGFNYPVTVPVPVCKNKPL